MMTPEKQLEYIRLRAEGKSYADIREALQLTQADCMEADLELKEGIEGFKAARLTQLHKIRDSLDDGTDLTADQVHKLETQNNERLQDLMDGAPLEGDQGHIMANICAAILEGKNLPEDPNKREAAIIATLLEAADGLNNKRRLRDLKQDLEG